MKIAIKSIKKLLSLTHKQSFALNKIDLKLTKYLNFQNGYFIEAGANNGINQSNTLYFEKYHQWQGILIEPIPKLAHQCRLNRPQCIVENCALVPLDYQETEIEMQYCNLMSLVKGAMKTETEEHNHLKTGCEIQKLETYTLKVPVKTFTAILDKYKVKKIDLLSLDVEGFELNVLKGIDFDKYKPAWMLIEARYREEIDSFLNPLYEPVAELSYHDVLYKFRKI